MPRRRAERRADPTDPGSEKKYTRAEFVEFYGAKRGAKLWDKSATVAGSPRGPRASEAGRAMGCGWDGPLLRSLGHDTVETMARHVSALAAGKVQVKPDVTPGELAKQFGAAPPEQPTPFGRILRDFERKVLPGVTHWQHPRFCAYYPSSGSVPAILAEALIGSINSVGLQWAANPIGTELEVVVMDWLAQMIGIGGPFMHRSGEGGGLIRQTAGEAIADMYVCARVQTQLRLGRERDGAKADRAAAYHADSSRLVAYFSD
eukprot:gene9021-12860_t